MRERFKETPHKFDEAKAIKITPKWKERLAKFEYHGKSKYFINFYS